MSNDASSHSRPTGGDGRMTHVLTCEFAFSVTTPADVVVQVAAAGSAGHVVEERFEIEGGASPRTVQEFESPVHGARSQIIHAGTGRLAVGYRAEITSADERAITSGPARSDGAPSPATTAGVDEGSSLYWRQVYLRPSRYCPSDHLVGFAVAEFGAITEAGARVAAITEWIRSRVGYVLGSSTVHDSAEDTLLTGMGTCRDFAHLGVALCRATGIPARFTSVYAPGLSPMDFHAVFESYEAGRWYVHDATGLAPRPSLVRIATGRDAADTAFAAITSGTADLETIEVSATVRPFLPTDDPARSVQLR